MEDIGFMCARCGGEVHDVTHNREGTLDGVGYRHNRRVEPWDHELELAVGAPEQRDRTCDFCGVSGPSWLYCPTLDPDDTDVFEVELDTTHLSDDDTAVAVLNMLYPWYACDTCSVLVADRNVEQLIARALERTPVPEDGPVDEATVRARLTGSLSVFFSTRPGRPQPSRAL
ncbi:hypothetical protein Acsp04_59160 [Actinomadura sp. NBRC 104425]|uniref:hypothetical protein n=1 Tax=Actinomadura sp. NBRC 104425 TaxID=3032204 RepID=UPI00249FA15F|nr:hypothetical protein [Actinomadura sp. NBRC 104425]GLZ15681.1 hypothetical protein Acsp04_59160 [Actinomadura sp. NBRC 104425]